MSVYFITARQVEMVKIGCAFNPRSRLITMQTGCPIELELAAMLKGAREEERGYHARFAHLRVRGEWFKITPEIEAVIAANPAPITKFSPLFLKRAREMQGSRPVTAEVSQDAKRYAQAMAEMHADRASEKRIGREGCER